LRPAGPLARDVHAPECSRGTRAAAFRCGATRLLDAARRRRLFGGIEDSYPVAVHHLPALPASE
jgi:hypothetical protein